MAGRSACLVTKILRVTTVDTMFLRKVLAALSASLIGFAPFGIAVATVIDTTGGPRYETNGWLGMAQTFVAPVDDGLEAWTFFLAPRPGGGKVGFSIHDWSLPDSGPVDAPLFSTFVDWNPAGGAHTVGIGRDLVAGHLYGALIDLLGYTNLSVEYTDDLYRGGTANWSGPPSGTKPPAGPWTSFSALDQRFVAVFARDAVPVPEPGSLALVGLALLVGWAFARREPR